MVEVRRATRLAQAFAAARGQGRPALIAWMVPGYPTPAEAPAIFDAIVAGGADIVEVGIPFSDPLADGATIQRATFQALEMETTPGKCVDFIRAARGRHPEVPIVIMSSLNPVLAYGVDRMASDAGAAGADAIILTDLPPEEADAALAAFRREGMDIIFLVAPTSSEERIQLIASRAAGFIYCVSVAGVTGARSELPSDLPDFLARVRRCTNLPLAVGFGISRRDHIEALISVADGVAVGSALVNVIAANAPEERANAVREYVEVLSGRRRSLS